MKKNIILITMLIITSSFILSACTTNKSYFYTTHPYLNNEKETETINITEEIKEPEITFDNEKPTSENVDECNFSRSTYYNGEEWCTENGVCYKNYEDFLEAQLQIYSDKLTEKLNPGKYYEIDSKMLDPLLNPRIKDA